MTLELWLALAQWEQDGQPAIRTANGRTLRKPCDKCTPDESRKLHVWSAVHYFTRTCPYCKGRGYQANPDPFVLLDWLWQRKVMVSIADAGKEGVAVILDDGKTLYRGTGPSNETALLSAVMKLIQQQAREAKA